MANWIGWLWVCLLCLPLAVITCFCNNLQWRVKSSSKFENKTLNEGVKIGYPKVKLWKQVGNVFLMFTGWCFVFPFLILFPFFYLLRLCMCSCCIWGVEDGIHDIGIYDLENIRRHKSCMELLEFQSGSKPRGAYY